MCAAAKLLGQFMNQRRGVERFLEPAVDAARPALQTELFRGVPAHAYDLQAGKTRIAPHLPNHGRAIHARQAHVQKQNVGLFMAAQVVQRVGAVAYSRHLEPRAAEITGKQLPFVAVVFHKQRSSRDR